MGSTLERALTNLFMGYNEQKWLESDYGRLAKTYRWGMWTISSVFFQYKHQAMVFLNFLNIQHPNLNFTIEKKHVKQLLFFDARNTRSDRLITSVYRKNIFAELLQNYNSFVSFKCLIKTLIQRTFRLSNTWDGFQLDFEKLKVILQKEEYHLS